jgi:hypothetical protein
MPCGEEFENLAAVFARTAATPLHFGAGRLG